MALRVGLWRTSGSMRACSLTFAFAFAFAFAMVFGVVSGGSGDSCSASASCRCILGADGELDLKPQDVADPNRSYFAQTFNSNKNATEWSLDTYYFHPCRDIQLGDQTNPVNNCPLASVSRIICSHLQTLHCSPINIHTHVCIYFFSYADIPFNSRKTAPTLPCRIWEIICSAKLKIPK